MKRTKEDALITKNRIIDKAVELFLENGFSNTTLNQIAQKAGVTRGAIYWHFKDKLDIINDLLDQHSSSLSEIIQSVLAKEISEFAKIVEIVEKVVDNFFNNHSFRDFIKLTWFKMEYTNLQAATEPKEEFLEYFIHIIEELVKTAQRNGTIKNKFNALTISLTITNQIIGMYRLHFIIPNYMNRQYALDTLRSYLSLLKNVLSDHTNNYN